MLAIPIGRSGGTIFHDRSPGQATKLPHPDPRKTGRGCWTEAIRDGFRRLTRASGTGKSRHPVERVTQDGRQGLPDIGRNAFRNRFEHVVGIEARKRIVDARACGQELARMQCYRVLWMRQNDVPCQDAGAMVKWFAPSMTSLSMTMPF